MCCSHDVVHIDLHKPIDKTLEDLVHEPLVGCSSVLQAKWHHLIAVVDVVRHEDHLLFIPGVHAYLVVAKVSI